MIRRSSLVGSWICVAISRSSDRLNVYPARLRNRHHLVIPPSSLPFLSPRPAPSPSSHVQHPSLALFVSPPHLNRSFARKSRTRILRCWTRRSTLFRMYVPFPPFSFRSLSLLGKTPASKSGPDGYDSCRYRARKQALVVVRDRDLGGKTCLVYAVLIYILFSCIPFFHSHSHPDHRLSLHPVFSLIVYTSRLTTVDRAYLLFNLQHPHLSPLTARQFLMLPERRHTRT